MLIQKATNAARAKSAGGGKSARGRANSGDGKALVTVDIPPGTQDGKKWLLHYAVVGTFCTFAPLLTH